MTLSLGLQQAICDNLASLITQKSLTNGNMVNFRQCKYFLGEG